MIRRATFDDIPAISAIYEAILDREDAGTMSVGWRRGIYPTAETAKAAVSAGEMYVAVEDGAVVASARINREQMPAYAQVPWRWPAPDDRVLVMHTLTVDPAQARRGLARQFLRFYEDLARKTGCQVLRIDTNARNGIARAMYAHHGYVESGVIPCTFNDIPGVNLVCMEKKLD